MSSSSLPLYFKHGRTVGPPGRPRSPVKSKETYLLVALLIMFIIAWCALITYLPEIQAKDSTSFENAYRSFIHRVPLSSNVQLSSESTVDTPHHTDSSEPHVAQVIHTSKEGPEVSTSKPPKINRIKTEKTVSDRETQKTENGNSKETGTHPSDSNLSETNKRQEKVKQMIKHAWDGYFKYALGENEVKPLSKKGHSAAVFGRTHLGATLVDSLDTLYIAGLHDEFHEATKWVKEHFHIAEVASQVSFFEFNIRFIGGFLSAYALSGEEIFKQKALELADKLMPAFNTPSGIPKSLVNLKTGALKNWGWASGKCSVLSEIGTLQLEYQYLTMLAKKPIYLDKVLHIRKLLKDAPKSDGLYPNFINPDNGRWGTKHISLGALGDSFYEYLLKAWLITSKHDIEARDMFYNAIEAIESKLFQYVLNNKFLLVNDLRNGRKDGKMQHLACFSGGMYALASVHAINGKSKHYMDIAKNITRTCRESYVQTGSNLGPEAFRMDGSGKINSRKNEKMYLLRPETVESYFYLWRLTKDPMYREWGWDVVKALESHCRVDTGGYSGIKDSYSGEAPKDDVQQSFFIAETLKYLYLLFSDDSVISLDKWVFNTEAHPLPLLDNFPTNMPRLSNNNTVSV